MSDEEREALLKKIQASTEEARKMTREEARKRLQTEGYCDERGRLTADYGGKATHQS